MNLKQFYTTLQTEVQPFHRARYGLPRVEVMTESSKTSFWTNCSLPCGHPDIDIVAYRDNTLCRLAHQMTGDVVATYATEREAIDSVLAFVRTMPATREKLLLSIEPETMRRILAGEAFPRNEGSKLPPVILERDWTYGELTIANCIAREYFAPTEPIRTFDSTQLIDLVQCVCGAHRR